MAVSTTRPLENLPDGDLFRAAAEPPAPEETPPETEAVETPPPEPPAPPTPSVEPPEAGVPSWRLREEAEARRLAEDRARTLEARLQEIATHLQQQVPPPQQKDFFESPDQSVQAAIIRTLQPFAAEIQRNNEDLRRTQMYIGKMVASVRHGEDKVEAAEQAFLDARARETLDPADYERVVQSPNRYDAVVKWHKHQTTLAAVGDDPDAWFERKLSERMADPTFQAKMLGTIQSGAASRPSEVRLPPSLSTKTAAASNATGPLDASDSGLWSFATAKR